MHTHRDTDMHAKHKTKSNTNTMALRCLAFHCGVDLLASMWQADPSLLKKHIVWASQSSSSSSVLALSRSLSTSTAFLSTHYNQRSALGATWSLAGWLSSLRSAGCERGHLSRALQVSGERQGKDARGYLRSNGG